MSNLLKGGYLDLSVLSGDIIDRISAMRKVSRLQKEEFVGVEYVLNLIDSINQLPEYEVSYGGYRFEDIKIPHFLTPFVWPAKVSFKPGTKYVDLRRVHEVGPVSVDLNSLKTLQDRYNSVLKCDDKAVPVSELRRTLTIDDVKFSTTVDGVERVISDSPDDIFIPVPLVSAVGEIIGHRVFNEDANYVINLFVDYNLVK